MRKQAAPVQEKAPGAFRADGSYNEDAWLGERGQVDGLVRSLCRRRSEGMAPEMAAALIVSANAQLAFPYHEQWVSCVSWRAAWTSTTAEETVKRGGLGSDGHWCGEKWVLGSEKDCPVGHKPSKPTEDTRQLLSGLIGAMK